MAIRKWVLDPVHTQIQFKVRHMMISTVTGSFSDYEGTVETEEEDFMKAKVNFSAEVGSLSTGSAERDAHLKGPEFFDSAKHPLITFKATKYESVDDDGSYELYGDLTVKGVTRSLRLDVEFGGVVKDPWGNTKAGFTINGKINRKDFGLEWNVVTEAGGILVGEEVKIALEVQLIEHRDN
ncbi:MAG: polyisoprenoid-binding protein [Chitinophagaceae bacterium]|nr:MAG: polyisoprenoid-binding protein [Chitinophagaceae bacterium]